MAGIFILILLFFTLYFVLTRRIFVKIIKDEYFKIEIHLPLLAIHLITQKSDKKEKPKSTKIGFIGYFRIITDAIDRLSEYEIYLERVSLPIKREGFSYSTFLLPIGQETIIYSAVTYLKAKVKKLIIKDNAISLSPDVENLHFYLTVKLRLYHFISIALFIFRRIKQERLKNKE